MADSRQIMLQSFEFANPERIPVYYHPSPAGLFVHRKKLLDLFNEYPPDNPVKFDSVPLPEKKFLTPGGGYHEIKCDEWGSEWEYLIYGIQGHPKSYPFADWEEAIGYRFPVCKNLFGVDLDKIPKYKKDYLIFSGWISIFEKLHALRPMDKVLVDLYTGNKHLINFLDRLVEYWLDVIQKLLDAVTDVIMFGDDWGTQTSTIISPELFRKLFKPRYEILMAPVKKMGRRVFFHSCGFPGEIFDELLELGIDGIWPQISMFENNPEYEKKCAEHKVTLFIHPDRQKLIPLGTPDEIRTTIRNYAEKYKKLGGGGIFYVEVENDAPFENVEALIESIDRYR